MDNQHDVTASEARNALSNSNEVELSRDHVFQLELLRQQNERRKRIQALKRARIKPLGKVILTSSSSSAAAAPSTMDAVPRASGYYDYIFLDGTMYDDICVEQLLENDPKLYEDLRKIVHARVPDKGTNLCFCGYYSSKAEDLDTHIHANSASEDMVETLLERLPATKMCKDCQRVMEHAAHGDFTNTWYDGCFSLLDWSAGNP